MAPSTHHRLWGRARWLGFLVGLVCLIHVLANFALGINYFSPGTLLDRMAEFFCRLTGLSFSARQVAILIWPTLIVVAIVCLAGPPIAFRWFIRPNCRRCGRRMSVITESGVQYLCLGCGHCDDTGTMSHLITTGEDALCGQAGKAFSRHGDQVETGIIRP